MRLLHVVPTYWPATRYGGPIVAVRGLCRALAARGHQVEVLTTSIDGPRNMAVPHDTPVVTDGVAIRYFASTLFRRLSYAPALKRALPKAVRNADVVHLHSVFLWPTWCAARVAEKFRTPFVISPRGMLVKKLILERHRLIKLAWIALIEKSNLEKAAAIHATSQIEAEEIEKFGWRLRRIAVVPNGIEDVDVQKNNSHVSKDITALGREQPLILCFGRMARVKGLDRLLEAFARTQRGVLAIVGTDYEGLTPELSRLAERLNIRNRVRFIARTVTGVDKERAFAAAQLFVLPSYSESFGNSVLEALQRGVPALVTPQVGAAQVVRESGGGLVVDGDPESFGQSLDALIADAAICRAMGQAGRQHVTDQYGWQSIAARMETLYESLRATH